MRIRPPHVQGRFYHVMLRGNRKQTIFRDDRDLEHLNRLVKAGLEKYDSEVHAFCWMPNHLHLLIRVGDAPVYRLVHYFATMYAKYFNHRHGLVGHLFQGRYKSRFVDSDGYFLQLIKYIHRNPVEGGLVPGVELFAWSSMRAYLGQSSISWLNTSSALAYFSGDRKRLLSFVRLPADEFDPWRNLDARGYQDDATQLEKSLMDHHWRDLEELLAAGCECFRINLKQLKSEDTRRHLSLARCWIANEALKTNVASLSEVARLFNRSPAALSRSIRINSTRLKNVKR